MENKYFIILGGHNGSIVKKIRDNKKYKDYFIYVYEPNPIYIPDYKEIKNIELISSAAWIYDGEIRFYVGSKKFQGHSIMKEKSNINIDSYINVSCIDFSRWITEKFNDEDYIEIRMDIEGGEYDVLLKMINDGSINFINKIFVEFHHYKYPELDSENKYKDIMQFIPAEMIKEI